MTPKSIYFWWLFKLMILFFKMLLLDLKYYFNLDTDIFVTRVFTQDDYLSLPLRDVARKAFGWACVGEHNGGKLHRTFGQ